MPICMPGGGGPPIMPMACSIPMPGGRGMGGIGGMGGRPGICYEGGEEDKLIQNK